MESIENGLQTLIKNTIEKWVGENYGTQERDDPSWDIKSLSAHITNAIMKGE